MTGKAVQTIQEKTTRLAAAREKVRRFVDGGGDLKSAEAVPVGMEFIEAFAELAKEFGPEVDETSDSQNTEAFLKLFTFEKKRELEKYCHDFVIHSTVFANFILACESGLLPFRHKIHFGDHVPQHLNPTDQDLAALAANPVGPLQPGVAKGREEDRPNL
jgi:hypothetical protein